ncbi:MAG: DUF3159 domain-containing protein [Micrococcaceae bacterium]
MPEKEEPLPLSEEFQTRISQSNIKRNAKGEISLLASIGGYRGLAETIVPGTVFYLVYFFTRNLMTSVLASLVVAVLFCLLRLIQKTPFTQAIFGVLSVLICAFFATRSQNASDYYVPGFFTNAGYLAAAFISVAIKWPLVGIIFGFVFGEELNWRKDPARLKVYAKCTLVYSLIFILRLAVQLPLYFAGPNYVDFLGFARLAMGVPLYVLAVWYVWNIAKTSPPLQNVSPQQEKV